MNTHRPTVLLTGGSGVIGRAFIDRHAHHVDLVCLRGTRRIDDPRVTELAGDLGRPRLGLSPAAYTRLARRVDAVVHAAAVTKWTADPAELRRVNEQGTAAMLRLAGHADAPLHYLSTAFVVREAPSDERFAGLAAYLQSKAAAEELVRASGVPSVILRPSVVTGDSCDGRMAAFQGLHRVLGSMIRGDLPVLPAELGSVVDTVPQDVVVDAIASLVGASAPTRTGGRELWLTAGQQALTVGDLVGLCEEVSTLTGIGARRPRLMPLESVDRLILPLLDDVVSPAMRRMFVDFLESAWAFQSEDRLPSDLGMLGFAERVERPALLAATRRSLVHWAAAKGLLDGRPPADERSHDWTEAVAS